MIFNTQINGTPCKCRVLFNSLNYNYGDFLFNILGLNNEPNGELEEKVSFEDIDRLYEEYQAEMLG